MNELNFIKLRKIACDFYNNANCKYDNKEYIFHADMVTDIIKEHKNIFINQNDFDVTYISGFFHDLIEDAKLSYNNILAESNKDVADIVLSVTDVPGENRLMRHLLTMPKTVKDYRAIVLKLCDIHANASYSKANGTSMYKKYVEEYSYRKPIFRKALTWYYDEFINKDEALLLWNELDEIHLK